MANLKSSKKDVRRIEKKTAANKSMRSSLKTYIKKVRKAAEAGDTATLGTALTLANKHLGKAVARGIIHKNQAARRMSRAAKAANKALAASK
jgi:small subunit ribosomal protein S20